MTWIKETIRKKGSCAKPTPSGLAVFYNSLKSYFKVVNGEILCVGDARFLNNGMKRNIKYPRQNRCDILGREVVANAHERSSSHATIDDTILIWLPYAALIVDRSVFGAMCSQLKFTRSVKFNCELIMINNDPLIMNRMGRIFLHWKCFIIRHLSLYVPTILSLLLLRYQELTSDNKIDRETLNYQSILKIF